MGVADSGFKKLASLLIVALAVACASPAFADVKPGDFITADKAYQVRDLVSPGVFYKVQRGMSMKIVPAQRVDWPPPYKDATEKYSGQVGLSSDHRTVLGYVAGQPFPLIDPNDPYAATKIIWNNVFRPISSDDYDLRFFDCDVEYTGLNKPYFQVGYGTLGHYAGYDQVGRVEVEPMPTDPDFKKNGRLWLFYLGPVLAPATDRGDCLLRYRYADPNRADDTWTYLPAARRLRRLDESINSSSTGAQSWDPDHYSGFNPKTEEYNYRFVGERNMLGSIHAEHSPEVRCPTDGGASACPEAWEMRHMYIVEATPRMELTTVFLHSKTLIYMDSEMWFEPYIDTYDRKGQLWQNHIYWLAYRDRPVPDAKVAIYPFKRAFVVGADSTDEQSGMSTMCYLPGFETPERECWYINMGAVDKAWFTTEGVVKAAEVGMLQ